MSGNEWEGRGSAPQPLEGSSTSWLCSLAYCIIGGDGGWRVLGWQLARFALVIAAEPVGT